MDICEINYRGYIYAAHPLAAQGNIMANITLTPEEVSKSHTHAFVSSVCLWLILTHGYVLKPGRSHLSTELTPTIGLTIFSPTYATVI